MSDTIQRIIDPRAKDLGDGFRVRRVLPFHAQKMVGPFIFFDHFGPVQYAPGEGFDVRPHPHIGLATVTYLFEGAIQHKDSLGSDLAIRPGAVNWMTAGRGIVHSERTPPAERADGQTLHGLQTWVALPKSHEEIAPAFTHHPEDDLPEFRRAGAHFRILAGEAWGFQSPVSFPWPILYIAIEAEGDALVHIEGNLAEERAIYIARGAASIGDTRIVEGQMAVLQEGADTEAGFEAGTLAVLCGGGAMDGPRLINWNFVASSEEKISAGRHAWKEAIEAGGTDVFPCVPGDDDDWIPLPP